MGMWSQARAMAAQTPEERNRYVDFLRAVSILFVIVGHWLITTAEYDPTSGVITPVLALEIVPWTAWLSWLFQVMPIFFIVGGYSNAISLAGAERKGLSYAQWLTGRLHRLLTPLTALVLFWAGLSLALTALGASSETVVFLSRTALVPTWFLAIYTMIVLLAPATHAFWRRYGFASLGVYIALAIAVDGAYFLLDMKAPGWTNYFWVWLAMHHLGFVWQEGRLPRTVWLLILSAAALAVLYYLTVIGPYPIAMAGSPGEEVSNTLPPKITLITLGLAQFGLLMALENPMRKALGSLRLWTATVLVNSMIMSIYLWHMTVLLALFAASYYLGGVGLTLEPGSSEWWLARPAWLLVPGILLVPVALLASPLERLARGADAPVPAAWRLVLGAVMTGAGITMATLLGFNGTLFSVASTGAILLLAGGAWICGILPISRSRAGA
ncbi:MAG: acyltransferase [Pseudomonadota bacterium]